MSRDSLQNLRLTYIRHFISVNRHRFEKKPIFVAETSRLCHRHLPNLTTVNPGSLFVSPTVFTTWVNIENIWGEDAKFRSGNLVENENKNRWNLPTWRSFRKNSRLHLSFIPRDYQGTLIISCSYYSNNSPHGKLQISRPKLRVFAPYVLKIYSCCETCTCHKQRAWVTCELNDEKCFRRPLS